ncbi:MAG TPA: DedA family protein [Sedimenticola thiotaurini]|uniref:DedA family protein n=1 Tax=Sedimenticola thiotaurini TaxID=1543721 RepID=A0A831RL39_9GAMM|nr:DedA family protein [Sedimenticola thiotaurini]
MSEAAVLWGIFGSGFLAATLLPGGSEATLAYALNQSLAPVTALWAAATLGNTLGGLSSWVIGWWLNRRFPGHGLHRPEHRRALQRIQRYGSPLLLLSWLPLVGDPLCVAAGWAGIRLAPATLFIALGKGARYALLVAAVPTG